MTKIISYNINGIRAAIRKGLVDWLKVTSPDIICFQEIKAFETQFDLNVFKNLGYKTFDTWIDESYDSIEDEVERFYSAIDSIRNFVKQDYETLNQIMKEMLPTLEHNAQVLDKNNSSLYVNLKLSLLNALR